MLRIRGGIFVGKVELLGIDELEEDSTVCHDMIDGIFDYNPFSTGPRPSDVVDKLSLQVLIWIADIQFCQPTDESVTH